MTSADGNLIFLRTIRVLPFFPAPIHHAGDRDLFRDKCSKLNSVLAAAVQPDVRFGSFSEVGGRIREVRSASSSGHRETAPACPKSAKNGHCMFKQRANAKASKTSI